MLIRALIVLLVVLNLGVAGWWLTRAAPVPPVAEQRKDVALLELTDVRAPQPQVPAVAAPALAVETQAARPPPASTQPVTTPPEAAAAATAPAPPTPSPESAGAVQCLALGPFEDQAAAHSAQARLVPAPRSASVRGQTPPAKAYAVLLPPLADRAAAQAEVERIKTAGFDDLMVINSGPSTNGVALGRYGSREAAQRRQAELRAGGFEAQIQPVGQDTQWWLDVELGPGQAEAARRQAQAARAVSRDCG